MSSGSPSLRPQRVYDRLKRDIAAAVADGRLRAGERIKSLQALSREYGISVNSARQAIHDLAAENLLDIRGVRGTFVAARQRSPRAVDVRAPILLVFGMAPESKFDSGQFKLGVLEEFSRRGWQHVVFDCPVSAPAASHYPRLRELLAEQPVGGLIMRRHTPFFLRELGDLPTVFANNYRPPSFFSRCARIEFSLDEMAFTGTEHLIAKGHRRIGIISPPPGGYYESWPVVGYEVAMNSHGLPVNPGWIGPVLQWLDREQLHADMDRYFRDNPDLTAVCITDDYGCAMALDRLHELSPARAREMAVVSWANRGGQPLWRRPVIRVEVDHVSWGRQAAELLAGLLAGTVPNGTVRAIRPALIEP